MQMPNVDNRDQLDQELKYSPKVFQMRIREVEPEHFKNIKCSQEILATYPDSAYT